MATAKGNVMSITITAGPWEQHLCGRLLGMRITSDGFIYTVDAYKGLSKVDMKTGTLYNTVIASSGLCSSTHTNAVFFRRSRRPYKGG